MFPGMFPRFRAAKLLSSLLSLAKRPVLTAPSCTMAWLNKKPAAIPVPLVLSAAFGACVGVARNFI